jgi:uncharacterized protein YecE (DUF72 family)
MTLRPAEFTRAIQTAMREDATIPNSVSRIVPVTQTFRFQSPAEFEEKARSRLNGPKTAYGGRYDTRALARWAKRISIWSQDSRTVYCYFDGDERGYAVDNALRLQAML